MEVWEVSKVERINAWSHEGNFKLRESVENNKLFGFYFIFIFVIDSRCEL